MKLTTKSEYSILALAYLAKKYDKDEYVKATDICEKHDITKKYLEQLMYILKRNNIIKTKSGSNGGYRLAKSPRDISLAEVIRAMDGPLASTASVSRYFHSQTPLSNEKKVIRIFSEIRNEIAKKLERTKLSDII